MIHDMRLEAEPFQKMKSGNKTIELRLFDYKRRKIDVGDGIIFSNLDNPTLQIAVTVKALHRYATFEDLFMSIPMEKCGFESSETIENATAIMGKYYTPDKISLFGVVGIEVELADTEEILKAREEQYENYLERLFPDGMK